MKDFVLFIKDRQSMYFMSTGFLKDNINGVRVPQLQLAYIHHRNNPSGKNLVKLCHELHYMWWGNKYLELQEWEGCIKSNKTIILANIILVPNKNPHGYKGHDISFISFPLEKVLLSLIGYQK